ncbi:MAG: hypothetical protein ACRDJ9_32580, partial [Dehalococcoidia bacterium]
MRNDGLSAARRIMTRQHGAIERSQAVKCGLTSRIIQGLVAREEWVVRLPRVYVQAGSANTWQQHLTVVSLWAGEGAAFCGRTAGYLHGLLEERPTPIEIWSPRRVRAQGIRVVRSWPPARGDVVVVNGFRVVHPCRALLELSAVLD